MKNKIHFFAMAACCAAVMLFSGCEKEHAHVITATIEDAGHPAKVHLVDVDGLHYPHFVEKDTIIVNGQKYVSEGTGQTCKFLALVDDAEASYYAVYPASALAVTATGTNYSQPSIVLPAKQVYSEESGEQRLDAPMCGANTQDNIKFHNLCSVMKVNVKNPADATTPITVSSIEITSPSYKLNYPSGLQISKAMNASDDTQREWLNASTFEEGESHSQGTVTLTNTSAAGSIAAGESKPFYIYLPTFRPASAGERVSLTVKVTTLEGSYKASYSRTARLDSLKRNIINDYNFLVNPTLRQVEEYFFFNVGTEGSPVNVDFAKHNEGAVNQYTMGGQFNGSESVGTSSTLLTPAQWKVLFTTSGNGFAKVHGQYGFVLLPPSFEYPISCDGKTPTPGTADNSDADKATNWTVTIIDNGVTSAVREYSDSEWNDMESAGAVFIPMTEAAAPTEKNKTNNEYSYYKTPSMGKKNNMYCLSSKTTNKDNTNIKSFSISVGINLDKDLKDLSPYYIRTIENMSSSK